MDALFWVIDPIGSKPPNDFYCATRDIGQARVERLVAELIAQEWNEAESGLLAAVVGELVGNCFDHNLGQWRDVPGCWLETDVKKEVFQLKISDRGQGVLSSLKQALPELQNAEEALEVAFTKKITGRAPEQRGNGLKFVIRSLSYFQKIDFQYLSGSAILTLSGQINATKISEHITHSSQELKGTYVKLILKSHYEN